MNFENFKNSRILLNFKKPTDFNFENFNFDWKITLTLLHSHRNTEQWQVHDVIATVGKIWKSADAKSYSTYALTMWYRILLNLKKILKFMNFTEFFYVQVLNSQSMLLTCFELLCVYCKKVCYFANCICWLSSIFYLVSAAEHDACIGSVASHRTCNDDAILFSDCSVCFIRIYLLLMCLSNGAREKKQQQ